MTATLQHLSFKNHNLITSRAEALGLIFWYTFVLPCVYTSGGKNSGWHVTIISLKVFLKSYCYYEMCGSIQFAYFNTSISTVCRFIFMSKILYWKSFTQLACVPSESDLCLPFCVAFSDSFGNQSTTLHSATAELRWLASGRGEMKTFRMIMQITTENRFLKRFPTWPVFFEMSVTSRCFVSQQLSGGQSDGELSASVIPSK